LYDALGERTEGGMKMNQDQEQAVEKERLIPVYLKDINKEIDILNNVERYLENRLMPITSIPIPEVINKNTVGTSVPVENTFPSVVWELIEIRDRIKMIHGILDRICKDIEI
jgi:hypothetical protein